jgi:threonine dehydrogenase-like Zn-dependent dehydrogenase
MKAIVYDDGKKDVSVVDWPHPGEDVSTHVDSSSEYQALVKVRQIGICNTDLEIIKGYVEGYRHVLGHEGVAEVEAVVHTETGQRVAGEISARYVNKRVVVEINCPCDKDGGECGKRGAEFERNHYPRRTVLGIIGRDGLMAEYCMVPLDNCIIVPDSVSDTEAVFSEPLAAAYRVVEQNAVNPDNDGERIAVIGDGKLGLLIAHVLVMSGCKHVCHFGRHKRKLDMVVGTDKVLGDAMPNGALGSFDVVVEASGSPDGVQRAVELLRPMGTLILKTTCSLNIDPESLPNWSRLANDIVVNEKTLLGSRCGPQSVGIELLEDPRTKALVEKMVDHVYSGFEEGMRALEHAGRKGALKIQLKIPRGEEAID